MADDKKKTADEILDNLAEEMGVKDEKAPRASKDSMSGLDDIFGVSSKKKKKDAPEASKAESKAESEPEAKVEGKKTAQDKQDKRAAAPADDDAHEVTSQGDDRDEASDEDEDEAPKKTSTSKTKEQTKEQTKPEPSKKEAVKKEAPKKEPAKKTDAEEDQASKKPKKSGAGIDGIFSTGDDSADEDDSPRKAKAKSTPHLDEDDLGDVEPKSGVSGSTKAMIGVIAVLSLALLYVVGNQTSLGKNVLLVFKGEYREHKEAEKKRLEEEFYRKQLEGLERYGMLTIDGNPVYATIKLNGEAQFAPTSTGAYRQISLQPGISNFQDLKIKQKLIVEISAPGFETKTVELTEGSWKGNREDPNATFAYHINANLTPVSLEAKQEFDARLSSDTENDYFGVITLNSQPAGARIIFNNEALVNEKGEELRTPVTFDKAWVKDEKTGKLKEAPVRVDTPLDVGHKIEVELPDQPQQPKFIMQLNRQQWSCAKKPEAELKKLPKDAPLPMTCAYSYQTTFDFNGLKAYIQRIEDERKRVEAENQKKREAKEKELEAGATDKGVEKLTSK